MATRPTGEAVLDPLELLAEMSRDFAASLDIEATLSRALETITRYLKAEGGAVFLLDDTLTTLTCTSSVGGSDITGIRIPSDQGIVGRTVRENQSEIVRDAQQDPRFYSKVDEQTGFQTRSILCAPLSVHDQRLGAIELVNKRGHDPRFTPDDLLMLETLCASAALAILNARMAEALVEQERVRRELELAAEIQRSLLPVPRGADFPVHGVNHPARMVSGDFFDFFALPDGSIGFNLGDVAGKGMNAALLMAKTASLYRCLGKTIHHPGLLLARINEEICETATRGMFVTMVGGLYDPRRGTVRLANAGHEPPLLHRTDDSFSAMPADAPPLGIVPFVDGSGFPEREFELNGGTLYLFTDGVTEGFLRDGGTLKVEGLKALIRERMGDSVPDRLGAVLDVFDPQEGALRDDVTVLAIDDRGPSAARRPPPPETPADTTAAEGDLLVSVQVPARADRLKMVRRAVDEAARLAGCSDRVVSDIVLAVDEACQNVIRHAYGGECSQRMALEIRRRGDTLTLLLRDDAEQVDVDRIRPRDLDDVRPGGLGTFLMREVMDSVEFLPPPPEGGNLLKMIKRIE